jgi:hypothetical protein
MPQPTAITIRAVLGLTKINDGTVLNLLKASLHGLTANSNIFHNPPVALATYSAAIDAYEASIPGALDGGKIAKEEKKKLRVVVLKMYSLLARYVETNCNDDKATFLLLGFQLQPTARTPTPPVSESIRKVERGSNSGQLKLKLMRNKAAGSYQLRWAPIPPDGVPTNWVTLFIALVQSAIIISDLTPGTTYAFQARALLDTGYTDWSDSVTLMCV